jgi:hypothetical protein
MPTSDMIETVVTLGQKLPGLLEQLEQCIDEMLTFLTTFLNSPELFIFMLLVDTTLEGIIQGFVQKWDICSQYFFPPHC